MAQYTNDFSSNQTSKKNGNRNLEGKILLIVYMSMPLKVDRDLKFNHNGPGLKKIAKYIVAPTIDTYETISQYVS